MTKTELLEQFLAFGESNGIEATPGQEPGKARFGIEHLGVTAHGTVLCEEDPASLQVICRLPVKTLPRHGAKMGQLLNLLNLRTRFGSFQFDPQDGEVIFRSGFPVHEEIPVQDQIAFGFGMAVANFGQAARRLTAFASIGGGVKSVLHAIVNAGDPDTEPRRPRRSSRNRISGPPHPGGLN